MNNYIYEYYQAITSKNIIVGKWILLLYQYIINGLEKGSFFYDPKKAKKAILYIENFCHHHEGAKAPDLIKLELWQKAFLSVVFGIVDETGARQFREVVLVMGRKQGKTLLSAAISSYMAYMDGEHGARLYFVAPKLDQAKLCFNAFLQMVNAEPELKAISKKRRNDLYIESTNTSAQPLAFNAKKSDGLNPSFCSCDELASWQGDAGIKQYEVITSALGARRQPLVLSITTASYINDGIYDELIKRATRLLLGDSKEKRLLPFLYMIDDVNLWNDLNELQKAMPNLGVSASVDFMLEEMAIAEQSLTKKAEFLCKYCCIKQNSSAAWLSTQTVEKAYNEHIELSQFRGSYCLVGIDLSQTTDLTAATVLIEKDGVINVIAKFWLPTERIEYATERDGLPYNIYIQKGFLETSGENFVDYNDVYNWVVSLVRDYELYPLQIGYDRYSAQYLIQALKADGFHTDDVYQGDNLYPILQEIEGLMKDGKINIGDNDLLKCHFLDSAIKMNVERGRGKLVKISPYAHIDGMAAMADAFTVRSKYYNEIGQQLKNEG